MAQRAAGFAKRHAGTEAIVAGAVMRSMEDDAAPRAVPLELAALVAPYRRHGRLSLRVERLPHRARLSRGQNNGDRSWSLMSDELDGLAYLPPKGGPESCTLAIRIVSLDGGDGGTLALIDYPVAAGEENEPPAPSQPAPVRDTAELRRLREELARAKEALAAGAREAEAQLAASSKLAAEVLERSRAEWQSEQAARAGSETAELRRLREELAGFKEALAREQAARSGGETRLADSQAQLERLKARASADSARGETERLAAAEARGEAKAAKALADAQEQLERLKARASADSARGEAKAAKALADAQEQLERLKTRAAAESARERGDDAERRRLRDEAARLKTALAAREEELAAARAAFERDGDAALKQAENAWRTQEQQRLTAARAQWQERSDRALAEAKARFERAQGRVESESSQRLRDAEAGRERALDDLTLANQAIAGRESDIAELQAKLDGRAREIASLRGHEGEIRRLNGEVDALREAVAARGRDIAQAREALRQAEQDWRAQTEDRLASAQAEWRKGESVRLQTAQAQAEEQGQAAQARFAQRVKQLEAELQQSRLYAEALQKRGDSDDIKQLRREFGHLQAQLSERDTEVAQLRLDSEHARERWTAEARITLQKAEHDWHAEARAAEREERRALSRKRTLRDVVLVGALSAVAVMLYFGGFTSWLPEPLAGWIAPPAQVAGMAAPHAAKPAARPMVTVLRAANLRSAPSKAASVIATLPRNAQLPSLSRQGNWVKVQSAGKEGWVYGSFLKSSS